MEPSVEEAPPQSPVLPPEGTTGIPFPLQNSRRDATSSVLPGKLMLPVLKMLRKNSFIGELIFDPFESRLSEILITKIKSTDPRSTP